VSIVIDASERRCRSGRDAGWIVEVSAGERGEGIADGGEPCRFRRSWMSLEVSVRWAVDGRD
jgi:hypothetical protein